MRHSSIWYASFLLGFVGIAPGQSPVLYSHGDPTPHEQLMLEWVNKARANPEAEMARLGIGLNQGLNSGQIPAGPKPPLAMNQWLLASARIHSKWMLDSNAFSHSGPGGSSAFQRMQAAGYPSRSSFGENISWQGTTGTPDITALTRANHDALMRSPGHRVNLLNPTHDEIGIGILQGRFRSGHEFNANMITQDFASSADSPTPSAAFILGVVFTDLDNDAAYDVGEGLGGVTISTSAGTHYAVTSSSGGYALPGPRGVSGEVLLFAQSGTLPAMRRTINWSGAANVKVDFISVGADTDDDGIGDNWDLASASPSAVHVGTAISWDPAPTSVGASGFEVKGLPRGLTFNKLNGQIRGRITQPGVYTVMVRLRRGTEWGPWQAVVFEVHGWPSHALGSHFGLVEREITVNQALGGTAALAVSLSGQFSGNVRLGGIGYGFRGQLDGLVGDAPRAQAIIPRKNLPPVLVNLVLNPDLTLGGGVSLGNISAPVSGWKKTWDTKTNALPSGLQGYHTAVLSLPDTPISPSDARPWPEGEGWMILRTDAGGTATYSGKTADGELFSGAFPMGPFGEIACWSAFPRNTGSVMGWGVLNGSNLDGNIGWVRLPSNTRTYPQGFGTASEPLALLVFGARYTTPAAGSVQSAWNLSGANPNAVARFIGANLPSIDQSLAQSFFVNTSGAVVMPGSPNNPSGVRLSLSPRDGRFSGQFTLVASDPNRPGKFLLRQAAFDGVILLRDAFTYGFGSGRFSLADLPATGQSEKFTPIRSGFVNLSALVPPEAAGSAAPKP